MVYEKLWYLYLFLLLSNLAIAYLSIDTSLGVEAEENYSIAIPNPEKYVILRPIFNRTVSLKVIACDPEWRYEDGVLHVKFARVAGYEKSYCVVEVRGDVVVVSYNIDNGWAHISTTNSSNRVSGKGSTSIPCNGVCKIRIEVSGPLNTVVEGRFVFSSLCRGNAVDPIDARAVEVGTSMLYIFKFAVPRGLYEVCTRSWIENASWVCRLVHHAGGLLVVNSTVPKPVTIEIPSHVSAYGEVVVPIKGVCRYGELYLDNKRLNISIPTTIRLKLAPGHHVLRAVCYDPPGIDTARVYAKLVKIGYYVVNSDTVSKVCISSGIERGIVKALEVGIVGELVNGTGCIDLDQSKLVGLNSVTLMVVDRVSGFVTYIRIPVLVLRIATTPTEGGILISASLSDGRPVRTNIVLKDGTEIVLAPQTVLTSIPNSSIAHISVEDDKDIVITYHLIGKKIGESIVMGVAKIDATLVDYSVFRSLVKITVEFGRVVHGEILVLEHDNVVAKSRVDGMIVDIPVVVTGKGMVMLTLAFIENNTQKLLGYVIVPIKSIKVKGYTIGMDLVLHAYVYDPLNRKYYSYDGPALVVIDGEKKKVRFVGGKCSVRLPRPNTYVEVYVGGQKVFSKMIVVSTYVPLNPNVITALAVFASVGVGLWILEIRRSEKETVLRTTPVVEEERIELVCRWSTLFERWKQFTRSSYGSHAIPLNEVELARVADDVACLPKLSKTDEYEIDMKTSGIGEFVMKTALQYELAIKRRLDKLFEVLKSYREIDPSMVPRCVELFGVRYCIPPAWLRTDDVEPVYEGSVQHNAFVKLVASRFVLNGWDIYAPTVSDLRDIVEAKYVPDLIACIGRDIVALVEVVLNPSKLSTEKLIDLVEKISFYLRSRYEPYVIIVTDNVIDMFRALARLLDDENGRNAIKPLIEYCHLVPARIGNTKIVVAPGTGHELVKKTERVIACGKYRCRKFSYKVYITDIISLLDVIDSIDRKYYSETAKFYL